MLRRKLKSPLGLLIRGSAVDTMERLKELVDEERPSVLISVGDVVSSNMLKHGLRPEVVIVDNRVMREKIPPIHVEADRTLHVKNAPGTLNEAAWTTVNNALKKKGVTRVLVRGEEDLLTLVAVICAPENSLVVYGQPHEGIVVVRVTEQEKERLRHLVEAMRKTA